MLGPWLLAARPAAAARRLGGRPLGRRNPAAVPPPPAPVTGVRPFGGMFAGLALGALLPAAGARWWAVVLAAVLFAAALALVVGLTRARSRVARRRFEPPRAYDTTLLGQEAYHPVHRAEGLKPAAAVTGPPDVDARAWLAAARALYERLQQAWDGADLEQLRASTTPELFEQLRTEIEARAEQPRRTEVVTLNAVLLDLRPDGDGLLASVEFAAMEREQAWAGARPSREIWNFIGRRDAPEQLRLAGIQELVP